MQIEAALRKSYDFSYETIDDGYTVLTMPRWLIIAAFSMILAEGLTLALFPTQIQQFLAELPPRGLQLMGMAEMLLALGLLAAALWS